MAGSCRDCPWLSPSPRPTVSSPKLGRTQSLLPCRARCSVFSAPFPGVPRGHHQSRRHNLCPPVFRRPQSLVFWVTWAALSSPKGFDLAPAPVLPVAPGELGMVNSTGSSYLVTCDSVFKADVLRKRSLHLYLRECLQPLVLCVCVFLPLSCGSGSWSTGPFSHG